MCLSISIGLIFVICTVFSRFWGCNILRFALVYYNNKFSELLYFSLAYSSLSSVLMPGDVYVSSCYLLSVSMSVPVKFDARSQTVPVVLVSEARAEKVLPSPLLSCIQFVAKLNV